MITILAGGSRGDVQPYVALGTALKKAGQSVRLATFQNFEPLVTGQGLEFYPVRGDVMQAAASVGARGALTADNPLKVLLSFNQLKSMATNLQQDFFDACEDADAIIYHPGQVIGYFIAREHGIPGILAAPFPMTPTREYPALIFYRSFRPGKALNRVTHKIFEQIFWFVSSASIRQFWRERFGRLPRDFGNPYPRQTTAKYPTIVSCSRFVFPQPSDWPEHIDMTGYWFLDEPDWSPPPALSDFLQSGSPPVYAGFGSIGDPDQAVQTTRLVIEALQSAGQRGVLATGWSGMAKLERLPESIFMLESAPHSWLFPRMAAVVHHGGAGTTAAGLRAGVPSVIVPYGNDTPAWGQRVYELGVGARPVQRQSLTAERLAQAIQFALSPEIRNAAAALGEKIRAENGAETAAYIITQTMSIASPKE